LALALLLPAFASAAIAEVNWQSVNGKRGEYITSVAPGQRLLVAPAEMWEFHAEGQLLGRTERIGPHVFTLPQGNKDITLTATSAIATQPPPAWTGDSTAIDLQIARVEGQRLRDSQAMKSLCTALLIGGVFFLLIPLYRPNSREYLWCGL